MYQIEYAFFTQKAILKRVKLKPPVKSEIEEIV